MPNITVCICYFGYSICCFCISFLRGYGFVRFCDDNEHKRAMVEMQGAEGCGAKPLRVSAATPKRFVVQCSDKIYRVVHNQYDQKQTSPVKL